MHNFMFIFINKINSIFRLPKMFIVILISLINILFIYDNNLLNAKILDETFFEVDTLEQVSLEKSALDKNKLEKSGNINFFDVIIKKAKKENWHFLTNQDRIILIAKNFVGTKYIAGSLENPKGESQDLCIVEFGGLDCFTFVELVINLNKNISLKKYTYNELTNSIFESRYKSNSKKDSLLYTDRLHYTSEWLFENTKRNLFIDVSKLLGGEKIKFNIGFMSQNPKYYPVLVNNPNLIEEIVKSEKKVNNSEFYYIQKSKVAKIENKIQNGDIILIATNKKGLDYSHLGFAYIDEKGVTRLMHASSNKKEVIIDNRLSEYLEKNNSSIGITVLRIK